MNESPARKGDHVVIHYAGGLTARAVVHAVRRTEPGVYVTNADLTVEERGGPSTFGTWLYHDTFETSDHGHTWFEILTPPDADARTQLLTTEVNL